jgi:predicted Zn finger-like uncharacterized protein
MILTCPACASRYVVDDSSVPPEGRAVRCSSCKTTWRAQRSTASSPKAEAPEAIETLTQAAAPADLPGDALPKQFRARVRADTQARKAAAAGAVWGGMAAVLVGLIATALIFRVDVARLWPKTASAYAAVGLKVNTVGLVVEDLKSHPALQDGRTAVVVSGMVRNVSNEPVAPPPLRVDLLDEHGERLVGQPLSLDAEPVAPGQARPFTISLLDPPRAAAQVEAGFESKRSKHAAKGDHGLRKRHANDAAEDEHHQGGEDHHPTPAEHHASAGHAPAPEPESHASESHGAPHPHG